MFKHSNNSKLLDKTAQTSDYNERKYVIPQTHLQSLNNIDKLNKTFELDEYVLNQGFTNRGKIVLIKATKLLSNANIDNEKLVLKISLSNIDIRKNLKREFEMSKKLSKIKGFIKYLKLYTCNDTYTFKYTNNINDKKIKPVPKPIDLCQSNLTNDNSKIDILVMHWFDNGSMDNYKWNINDSTLFKKLMIQVIEALYTAYKKYGFVHNDLELRNILIDNDNALIMDMTDYDTFFINPITNTLFNDKNAKYNENIEKFWKMIDKLLKNSFKVIKNNNIEIKNTKYSINYNNDKYIVSFGNTVYNDIVLNDNIIKELLDMINNLEFVKKELSEYERILQNLYGKK